MGILCRLLGHDWKEIKREKDKIRDVEKEYIGNVRLPSGKTAPVFTIKQIEREALTIYYECSKCGEKKIESAKEG